MEANLMKYSVESNVPVARLLAMAMLECIAAACDPEHCDPINNVRYGPAACYEFWAGYTVYMMHGKPRLDFDTWNHYKQEATSEIEYGRFLRVVESASFFVSYSFIRARSSPNRRELQNLMERLESAQVAVDYENGEVQTYPAMDFINAKDNSPELKIDAILDLLELPAVPAAHA